MFINFPGPNHQVFLCFYQMWPSSLTNGYNIFSVMIRLEILKGLLSIPAAKVGKLVAHSVGISDRSQLGTKYLVAKGKLGRGNYV
jgi:hypothetical protein